MKVDFHVHSTASDGTNAPAILAQKGAKRTFSAMAITDHDNCDGVDEFLAEDVALPRVAGIELSILPGNGFDKFHLLGLGIDPRNENLRTFLAKILTGRNERNKRILENFAKIGIDIAPEDIATYAHGEVLARPHFARWLMVHGFASSIKDAFDKYLLPDSPRETRCFEDRWHPAQEDAFATIHAAGGICVMAHPKYWRTSWKTEYPDYPAAEKELCRLKEAGLDGLEAMYEANTNSENIEWTVIATRVGLLKSAGSDFHGANKPNIQLGMSVDDAFIAPLLERLGIATSAE